VILAEHVAQRGLDEGQQLLVPLGLADEYEAAQARGGDRRCKPHIPSS
jgi:hypothetical protein